MAIRAATVHAATRVVAQMLLGMALLGTGSAHLTLLREEFRAQVPGWLPVEADVVVLASGIVEIALAAALVLSLLGPAALRVLVGLATAAFFVAIFPGNVAQYVEGTSAFGLETDRARLVRLFFQPLLVAWALWSTGAWAWLRRRVSARAARR